MLARPATVVHMAGHESVTDFFNRVREGDADAVTPLWNRFFPRIMGLAKKTLGQHRAAASSGADDAAQSAFFSFYQRVGRGEFSGALDRDDLWRLLATITVCKVRKNIRKESAEKRGGGNIVNQSALEDGDSDTAAFDRFMADTPSESFDLVCEELLMMLDEDMRSIAIMRLMGHTNREISETLECTERRIERKLQVIRSTWEEHVTATDRPT